MTNKQPSGKVMTNLDNNPRDKGYMITESAHQNIHWDIRVTGNVMPTEFEAMLRSRRVRRGGDRDPRTARWTRLTRTPPARPARWVGSERRR